LPLDFSSSRAGVSVDWGLFARRTEPIRHQKCLSKFQFTHARDLSRDGMMSWLGTGDKDGVRKGLSNNREMIIISQTLLRCGSGIGFGTKKLVREFDILKESWPQYMRFRTKSKGCIAWGLWVIPVLIKQHRCISDGSASLRLCADFWPHEICTPFRSFARRSERRR
jgi:hypothetical protein